MSDTNGHIAEEAERELEVHRHLMRFGEAESRVAPVWSMQDTTISAVADHLAKLWTIAEDDGLHVTEKGLPHARASVLNLIVTVPNEMPVESETPWCSTSQGMLPSSERTTIAMLTPNRTSPA